MIIFEARENSRGPSQAPRSSLLSRPLTVTIPHRLGKQEAVNRLRAGLSSARTHFGQVLAVEQEVWNGDTVEFRVRALGQTAKGKIETFDDHVRLEVSLPWLLTKFAETIAPVIRKQGQLLLDKK
jgi:Putative polyhydroxyalkanoic acid system protein (PHA_gran_rgn)